MICGIVKVILEKTLKYMCMGDSDEEDHRFCKADSIDPVS